MGEGCSLGQGVGRGCCLYLSHVRSKSVSRDMQTAQALTGLPVQTVRLEHVEFVQITVGCNIL